MKKILTIILLLTACTHDEPDYEHPTEPQRLGYNKNTTYHLKVLVIPMDNTPVDIDELDLIVNRDYFNGHDISIEFELGESEPLDFEINHQTVTQLKKKKQGEHITLYIVPSKKMTSGAGISIGRLYVIAAINSSYNYTTIAHEIAHNLTLKHIENPTNVMATIRSHQPSHYRFFQFQINQMREVMDLFNQWNEDNRI